MAMRSSIVFVLLIFFFTSTNIIYSQFKTGVNGLRAFPGYAPPEEETSEGVEIESFTLETQLALVEDFMMLGILGRFQVYDPLNIAVRYSVDLSTGDMYFIPYFGVTLPKIGGFEIGSLTRPDGHEFHIPGWVTWRIFGGDERIFAISADILTNVPIGNIGYYDAGVRFRIKEDGSTLYIGMANFGKVREEIEVLGPTVKSSWALGNNSFFLLNGSYILNHPEDPNNPESDYVRFTISAGWRVVI